MTRIAAGRTNQLTPEVIVDGALELIDTQGLEALTIRRLAGELGVSSMALYHHFPTKDDVVQAVVDRVWTEVTDAFDGLELPDDLTELILTFSVQLHQVFLRHFEIVPVAFGMPRARERMIASYVVITDMLVVSGFPDIHLAFYALQAYQMGSVSLAANRLRDLRIRGVDLDDLTDYYEREMRDRDGDTDAQMAVLRASLPMGNEDTYEAGLRILIAGLLRDERYEAPGPGSPQTSS